jgi:hypothetical protein
MVAANVGGRRLAIHFPCADSLAFFASRRQSSFTMRQTTFLRTLPYQLPWIVGIVAVFAVTGPFGSYAEMRLATRVGYFGVVCTLFWLQVVGLNALFRRIETINSWPPLVSRTLVGILVSIPGTIEIMAFYSWMVRPIPMFVAWDIFPQAAFSTVILSIVIGLFVDQHRHAQADSERARVAAVAAPEAMVDTSDFFRRIPPALGRDLLALEMEDHYLRIHTALGSDLILLRLRDAIAELGPTRGRQVHRSWWVAEGAVASVERNAGKPVLTLRNGLSVPVSKSFRDQLKEAGWLG